MTGYEWLPPPTPIESMCDECGHVSEYFEPPPMLGPLTIDEQRRRDSFAKIARDLNDNFRAGYSKALPSLLPDLTAADVARMVRG